LWAIKHKYHIWKDSFAIALLSGIKVKEECEREVRGGKWWKNKKQWERKSEWRIIHRRFFKRKAHVAFQLQAMCRFDKMKE
jgi:hypothetical protein